VEIQAGRMVDEGAANGDERKGLASQIKRAELVH
jgi:hypothetical protein